MIVLLISIIAIKAILADPASDQLPNFKKNTCGPIGILTTSNDAPVEVTATTRLNSCPIDNAYFMETLMQFNRQKIPERVVHAKGVGAFGYFEVTHNVTDICKAKLFSKIGKKTPIVVRFSQSHLDKGEPDTIRDGRGLSVKFLTEEGNLDIVALNAPMFLFKDPNLFPPFARALKRNPVTNLRDRKMIWDFLTSQPKGFYFLLYIVFGENGTPDGYRYMPGYSIHTYQVYNEYGESYFVRWHFIPKSGKKNLSAEEAKKLAVSDPDYAVRDLYNAIEKGVFPTWNVSLQVLSYDDVKKAKFDVFDITKILPEEIYPLRPIGEFTLTKNPDNYFADIEQLAFCPGNVVPGILGAPDQFFKSRRLAYRDALMYRLGANFNRISVNCPLTNVFTYDRDGVPPVGHNGGDSPNYYPNTYHGPISYVDIHKPKLINIREDDSMNFDQATAFYTNETTKEYRERMISEIVESLLQADYHVQQKAIRIFTAIHPDLAYRIVTGMAKSF